MGSDPQLQLFSDPKNLGFMTQLSVPTCFWGSVVVDVGLYGSIWIYMDLYGSIWIYMDLYGPIWIYMDLYMAYMLYTSPTGSTTGTCPHQLRYQNALPASTASYFPTKALFLGEQFLQSSNKRTNHLMMVADGFGKTLCVCSWWQISWGATLALRLNMSEHNYSKPGRIHGSTHGHSHDASVDGWNSTWPCIQVS